jgi:hypothetical protein
VRHAACGMRHAGSLCRLLALHGHVNGRSGSDAVEFCIWGLTPRLPSCEHASSLLHTAALRTPGAAARSATSIRATIATVTRRGGSHLELPAGHVLGRGGKARVPCETRRWMVISPYRETRHAARRGCRFSLVRRSFGRLVARSTALRAVLPGELSPSADGDRCRYRSLVPVAIC